MTACLISPNGRDGARPSMNLRFRFISTLGGTTSVSSVSSWRKQP